jgi:hypothetical protein
MIAKREQRRDIAIRAQPDRSPLAAIAAVGTTLRNVGLAAKRCTARAAITAFDIALRGIDKPGHDINVT